MISFSFDSATLVSIHEIPHGGGISWGKLNGIASLNWFLFFKQQFPFSHMLALFQDNFILVETTSSHFFRVTTSTLTVTFSGQVILQNSCCFLLFQNSHFFAGVIFSKQLLFRSKNSFFSEQPLLENRMFFTAVTFRSSYFFFGGTVQDKDT